jgi:hypothetical protein
MKLNRPRVPQMRATPTVQHVVQIDHWNFDYMFGISEGKFATGYYDFRHIEISGTIVEPAGIKATKGQVTCMPDEDVAASPNHVQRFVGHVYYRGEEYSAKLNFPRDALSPILQMLIAQRYRYLVFDAAPGGRNAEIFGFRFAEHASQD